MKPLVVVDFSHLYNRNLFVAINQAQPRKEEGKFITKDFEPYLKHLLFNSLQYIHNKFRGEMVLAMDAKSNWRKDFYKDYKGNRAKGKETSDLHWEELYELIENIVNDIKENFPFKVVKTEKAEADDIAGVISKQYGYERDVILVTSDHDWLQNTIFPKVKMYDPMKQCESHLEDWEKEVIDTPAGKTSKFSVIHTLIGDSGDNVPKVTFETEFSENFLAYLRNNEIMSTSVKEVKKMKIFPELVAKYSVYNVVKSGKRKGEYKHDYRVWYRLTECNTLILKDDFLKKYSNCTEYTIEEVYEKDIYKQVNFGESKAKKVSTNSETLNDFLNSHELYKENFIFSNALVDLKNIPENIVKNILKDYKEATVSYNPDGILNYFIAEGLGKLVNQVNKFYSSDYVSTSTSSLDDFF